LENAMTNDFDLVTIRKQLDALRLKHGADTAVGHRCSTLIGQLAHHPYSVGQNRKDLEKNIAKSVADLELLTAQ
jgi:hypothetical protein